MRSKFFLVSLIALAGCLDSHNRDNPLDEKSSTWSPPKVESKGSFIVKNGDPKDVLVECSATDNGTIETYIIEWRDDMQLLKDSSTTGQFLVPVDTLDISYQCGAMDNDGTHAVEPFIKTIHRNRPPIFDSLPAFVKWNTMDWNSLDGNAQIRFHVRDYEAPSDSALNPLKLRIDINGRKGVWQEVQQIDAESDLYSIEAEYNRDPEYRIVAVDELGDSSVIEGKLSGLDSIPPCLELGRTQFTDSRDNQVYSCAWIGGKGWMTQNLNYGVVAKDRSQDDDGAFERFCPGNTVEGCSSTGGYYQWAEAVGEDYSCNRTGSCVINVSLPQGVCPDGWHVPTKGEWTDLARGLAQIDPDSIDAGIEFNGYVNLDGVIQDSSLTANFWTSSTDYSTSAIENSIWIRFEQTDSGISVKETKMKDRHYGVSVRCILD